MNFDYLTPEKWEIIRKMDYEGLMLLREMFQPLDEEE